MNRQSNMVKTKPYKSFSLREMFLVFLIVALVVSNIICVREIYSLKSQIQHYIVKKGPIKLEVSDLNKVNVRALECPEPDTWEWEIYVPETNGIEWNLKYIKTDANGKTYQRMNTNLYRIGDPMLGEQHKKVEAWSGKLVAKFRKYDTEQWSFSIHSPRCNLSIMIPNEEIEWIEKNAPIPMYPKFDAKHGISWLQLGNQKSVAVDIHKPIQLFRIDYKAKSGEKRSIVIEMELDDSSEETIRINF